MLDPSRTNAEPIEVNSSLKHKVNYPAHKLGQLTELDEEDCVPSRPAPHSYPPTRRDFPWEGSIKELEDSEAERKQAEEDLRKTEATYRLVVDNMADVITVMDLNLRFTYVSPSVIRLLGYTAEEVMAQTLEQIMTPESLQIVTRVFEEELKLEASGTADPAEVASWNWRNTKRTVPSFGWRTACHLYGTKRRGPWASSH